MNNKLLSMLALLMVATTGAWAQEPEYIDLTTVNYKTWTLDAMPPYAVEMEVEYETELALANAGDNTQKLFEWDECEANVTLAGRTLYKDGEWNTLCLPFDVTIAGSELDGAEARTVTAASIEGTTLNLAFGEAVMTLAAGVPYIIKWDRANDYVDDDEHNITIPVFSGVTIDALAHNFDNGVSGSERVRFMGTYQSIAFTDENKDGVLLLGGNNKLYYAGPGAALGAQRAYLFIGGTNAAQARRLTSFKIDFGDGGNETGIIDVMAKDVNTADGIYTIDGRKLQGQPTQKGLYIVNGRKVVMK